MTLEEIKKLSYEEMVYIVRFAPIGDKIFAGISGTNFSKIMKSKRPSTQECIRISKKIGWKW